MVSPRALRALSKRGATARPGRRYSLAERRRLGGRRTRTAPTLAPYAGAVVTVPASSFYSDDPTRGRGQVRFSFPKKLETIERGIAALRGIGPGPT